MADLEKSIQGYTTYIVDDSRGLSTPTYGIESEKGKEVAATPLENLDDQGKVESSLVTENMQNTAEIPEVHEDSQVDDLPSLHECESVLSDLYNLGYVLNSIKGINDDTGESQSIVQRTAQQALDRISQQGTRDVAARLIQIDEVMRQSESDYTPAELLDTGIWKLLGLSASPFPVDYQLQRAMHKEERTMQQQLIYNLGNNHTIEERIQRAIDDGEVAAYATSYLPVEQQEGVMAQIAEHKNRLVQMRDEFALLRALPDQDGNHPWDGMDRKVLLDLCEKYLLIPSELLGEPDSDARSALLDSPALPTLLERLKNKGAGPSYVNDSTVQEIVSISTDEGEARDNIQVAANAVLIDRVRKEWENLPLPFRQALSSAPKPLDVEHLLQNLEPLQDLVEITAIVRGAGVDQESFFYEALFLGTDVVADPKADAKVYRQAIETHLDIARRLPKDAAQRKHELSIVDQWKDQAQLQLGMQNRSNMFGADGLRIYLAPNDNSNDEEAHVSLFFNPDGSVKVKEMQNRKTGQMFTSASRTLLDDRASAQPSNANFNKIEITLAESLQWLIDMGILKPESAICFDKPENLYYLRDPIKRDGLGNALNVYDPQKGAYADLRSTGDVIQAKDIVQNLKTRLLRTEIGTAIRKHMRKEPLDQIVQELGTAVTKYTEGAGALPVEVIEQEQEQVVRHYEQPTLDSLEAELRKVRYEGDDKAYYQKVASALGRKYSSNTLRKKSALRIISKLDAENEDEARLAQAMQRYEG